MKNKKQETREKHKKAYNLYMGSSEMTYDELAKIFSVTKDTVRKYVNSGERIVFEERRLRNAK